MKKKSLTKSLLIEIGVEELPSDAISALKNKLKTRIDHWLNEKNLLLEAPLRNLLEAEDSLQDIRIEVTPRRIVIYIEGLPIKQPDVEEEFVGPSAKAALSAANEPTQALLGFLKSKGATLNEMYKKTTGRGDFVAVRCLRKGVKTEKLLKTFLSELFSGFPFPKTMRWYVDARFPRPVRWILALWDKEILPFEYAGLKSDRLTYGHRFLADRAVRIKKADIKELESALKNLHVTLSFEKRSEIIECELAKTNPSQKIDKELIEMSASLTEDPVFIKGKFDERYLKLPEEILATSMRKHQKIFALYDKGGRVLPGFLAVVNGKKANPRLIQKNYENVLEAKLKDAEFFYHEDRKTSLEAKTERLKKVTFLGKLGTLFDKAERLKALAAELSANLGLSSEEENNLKRAAFLSKADLETQMVYEFPDLQGFAGAEYARADGESKAVSKALKDYYLPTSASSDDPLELRPVSKASAKERLVGALLGILDKLDTLVGAFGLGIEVKGSEDPYALRRAANGIVLTVFELKKRNLADLSFSLKSLIQKSAELYSDKIKLSKEEIEKRFKKTIEERVLWVLASERARDREILNSIFKTSSDDLLDVWNRFDSLETLEKKDPKAFYETYKILERTFNILKGVKDVQVADETVKPELFQTEEEKQLFGAFQNLKGKFQELMQKKSYIDGTKLYAGELYGRISKFFDHVLVNDKDESLRRNRLALMHRIYSLYTQKVADLSLLTQMEPPQG